MNRGRSCENRLPRCKLQFDQNSSRMRSGAYFSLIRIARTNFLLLISMERVVVDTSGKKKET